MLVGASVGSAVGGSEGAKVGVLVGASDGCSDGVGEGITVGVKVGEVVATIMLVIATDAPLTTTLRRAPLSKSDTIRSAKRKPAIEEPAIVKRNSPGGDRATSK
jgi:hypothetical protein